MLRPVCDTPQHQKVHSFYFFPIHLGQNGRFLFDLISHVTEQSVCICQEEFEHPLWKQHAQTAASAGHGGMDWFVIHAFIEALKAKAPMPIDIYDAVTWSAITPLSEQSIADGFQTLAFPDFTAGLWQQRKPIFAFDARY